MKTDAVTKVLLFAIAAFLGVMALRPGVVETAHAKSSYNPLKNAVVLHHNFVKENHAWHVEIMDRNTGRVLVCALKKGGKKSHCSYWSNKPSIR
ncbi:hypothetical protein ACFL2T_04730 [Elusimicrobiota bacterium]